MLFSIEDYISPDLITLLKKTERFYMFSDNGDLFLLRNTLMFKHVVTKSKFEAVAIANMYEYMCNGCKTIYASYDRCIALENISLNILFQDYRQPYSAFAIKFDDKYRQILKERYKVKNAPNAAIISQNEVGKPIIYDLLYKTSGVDTVSVIHNTGDNKTLEEYICDVKYDNMHEHNDLLFLRNLERIAMNMSLLLTHYGVKSIGKSKHPGKKHKNDEQYTIIEPIMQQIVFHDREEHDYESKGGTHKRPNPHWRKGHWLNQVCGPGRQGRKLQFRKPIFVCASDFKGDIGDTNVEVFT